MRDNDDDSDYQSRFSARLYNDDDSDYQSRFSARLYNVLEWAGVSEDTRLMHREYAMISEILETVCSRIRNSNMSQYIFGSCSEGTTTIGLNSDLDQLTCLDFLPVIMDLKYAPAGVSALIIADLDTKPGYIKLQRVLDGKPCAVFSHTLQNDIFTDSDKRGRQCYKHVSHAGKVQGFNERHGPADTIPELSGIHKANDYVKAFRCKSIPPFASHWVNEIGQYGWPSRQLLDRMKKHGCFLVGVGHPQSDQKDIEWRLSFSLQERDIMFSLNPVQHKCYFVLKYIKHDLIHPEIGESLSSYHCKTALFHVLKETPHCLWKPENLVKCVTLCLEILLTWAHDGNCPNFFLPEENMFDGRVNGIVRMKLETKLHQLLQDGYHFLFRIECDNIGKMLADTNITGSTDAIDQCKYNAALNSFINVYYSMLLLYDYAYVSGIFQHHNHLYDALAIFSSIRTVTEHNEKDTAAAISLLRPLVQLMTAKYLACQAYRAFDLHRRRRYRWLSQLHLELGATFDLTQSRLLNASVLYREEQYEQCSVLLEEVASDIKDYVVSCCGCYSKVRDMNLALLRKMQSENTSTHDIISTSVAFCIVFILSEVELIPVPLQYKLFKFYTPKCLRKDVDDHLLFYAVLDAKIYLYFLQYLIYSKTSQTLNKHVAIDNLTRVLNTDMNLGHRDTGYNLLGWIHGQEGRIQDAFTCFMESWKISPGYNTAVWHVGVLVWKCLCR